MDAKNDQLIKDLLKDPDYRVNEIGRVEKRRKMEDDADSIDAWRSVGWYSTNGYYIVKYKNHFLSGARIIYAALIGPLKKGQTVINKDGNKQNNSPENLEQISLAEQSNRSYAGGRKAPLAKLTWQEATEIRSIWAEGKKKYTQKKLAEKYGVSRNAISAIVTGRTYKKEVNHD